MFCLLRTVMQHLISVIRQKITSRFSMKTEAVTQRLPFQTVSLSPGSVLVAFAH